MPDNRDLVRLLGTFSTEADVAWAAGLFEGEGNVGLRSDERVDRFRTRHVLKLTSTDLDVLEKFLHIVGTGTIVKHEAPKQSHHKQAWVWSCSKQLHVFYIAQLFIPHMGQRRGDALRLVVMDVESKRRVAANGK